MSLTTPARERRRPVEPSPVVTVAVGFMTLYAALAAVVLVATVSSWWGRLDALSLAAAPALALTGTVVWLWRAGPGRRAPFVASLILCALSLTALATADDARPLLALLPFAGVAGCWVLWSRWAEARR